MTAALTLAPHAHMQAAMAELLVSAPRTMAELAAELGVSANDAEHILARLRRRGLPVELIEDLDPQPRYRVLYPKGRVCAAQGCGTLLRRTNPSDRCERHGGGVLRLRMAPAAPVSAQGLWSTRRPSQGSAARGSVRSASGAASGCAPSPPWPA